jgi:hypothetical protein
MEDLKDNISFVGRKIYTEPLALFILMIVSLLCRTPLIFQGFSEFDAACIAVSIIDFISHGYHGNFTHLYFLDVIPGYVLYIKLFMKFLDNNYMYLATVMNYTNVVIGTLIIIPCYYFIRRLLNNKSVAFFATLTFLFAPSIFRHSIYGLPPLLPLFFFITSLYFFLVWLDNEKYIYLLLSFLTLTATIFFKSDFVLGSGAYMGLLYMRGTKEKQKIVLTLFSIALSVAFFLLLRQWTIGHQYKGPDLGSTTSISGFVKWGERFILPVYNHFHHKDYALIIRTQVYPIIYGIGAISFFVSSAAFIYYLVKKRYDVLFLVISWAALPTAFWVIAFPNSQKHNMLSALPFVIIIFLFIHEKTPRLIAFFSAIIICGNFLLTSHFSLTNATRNNFIQNQIQERNRVNDLHIMAKGITYLRGNKVVFLTPSLKPYLLYELFSSTPGYETVKMNDDCYEVRNGNSVLCFNVNPADMLPFINKSGLDDYTIIAPSTDLNFLKERGFKVIDNTNIQSLTDHKGNTGQLNFPLGT